MRLVGGRFPSLLLLFVFICSASLSVASDASLGVPNTDFRPVDSIHEDALSPASDAVDPSLEHAVTHSLHTFFYGPNQTEQRPFKDVFFSVEHSPPDNRSASCVRTPEEEAALHHLHALRTSLHHHHALFYLFFFILFSLSAGLNVFLWMWVDRRLKRIEGNRPFPLS